MEINSLPSDGSPVHVIAGPGSAWRVPKRMRATRASLAPASLMWSPASIGTRKRRLVALVDKVDMVVISR